MHGKSYSNNIIKIMIIFFYFVTNFQDNGETTSGSKDGEKCISPIGAGLPLLSRLKLLKEKQVKILRITKRQF